MSLTQEQCDESTHRFEAEGVAIRIRAQSRPVKVRKLPLLRREDYPPKQGDFIPARLVINFEIVYEDGSLPPEFTPPFELEVRYTAEDLERARAAGGSPSLWFFNGDEWVPFTKEKHHFRLVPDRLSLEGQLVETGGFGVAYIRNWADPPVGWDR